MPNVKLLLNESVKNVGKVGDVVEVSPGYARNFLIPKGLAVEPTPNNVKKIEARRKEIERLERERREQQAAVIANKLATVSRSPSKRKARTSRATSSAQSPRPTSPRRSRPRASRSKPPTSISPASWIASTRIPCGSSSPKIWQRM